jgi:hypothetical protein
MNLDAESIGTADLSAQMRRNACCSKFIRRYVGTFTSCSSSAVCSDFSKEWDWIGYVGAAMGAEERRETYCKIHPEQKEDFLFSGMGLITIPKKAKKHKKIKDKNILLK